MHHQFLKKWCVCVCACVCVKNRGLQVIFWGKHLTFPNISMETPSMLPSLSRYRGQICCQWLRNDSCSPSQNAEIKFNFGDTPLKYLPQVSLSFELRPLPSGVYVHIGWIHCLLQGDGPGSVPNIGNGVWEEGGECYGADNGASS